jgi:hypothetical protein
MLSLFFFQLELISLFFEFFVLLQQSRILEFIVLALLLPVDFGQLALLESFLAFPH